MKATEIISLSFCIAIFGGGPIAMVIILIMNLLQ